MHNPDAGDPLFQANPRTVRNLLAKIHDKELTVPDFQRSFVWPAEDVRELLISVMSRYPAGTLLFLTVDPDHKYFKPRNVEGAPPLGQADQPKELVLDGQQRLTALYQALYGCADDRYFLDLSRMRAKDGHILDAHEIPFDEALLAIGRDENGSTGAADGRKWQLENWSFPLDEYLLANRFDDWLDDLIMVHAGTPEAQKALKFELRAIRDTYLQRLAQYTFPVVALEQGTSLHAVCKIFETLNLHGVRLTVFELLTARFWPEEVRLRDLWDDAQADFPIISEFRIDAYSILQSISLRAFSSAQRSDVLNLKAEHIKSYWADTVRGLAGALELMRRECGVLSHRWLPYSVVVVPMAAVWHVVEKKKGPQRGAARAQLRQYYWCTVFTSNFDQGANSQAGRDYIDLTKWIEGDSSQVPEAIRDFSFSRQALLTSRTNRRALYAGVVGLTLANGAKDFHNGQPLTVDDFQRENVDSHHVFPKRWLSLNYSPSHVDREGQVVKHSSELILNRAFIDKETNQTIRARAPSAYLADIRNVRGDSALNEILDTHFLPNEPAQGLFEDDYDDFLLSRLDLIVGEIELATGKSVSRDVMIGPAKSENRPLASAKPADRRT